MNGENRISLKNYFIFNSTLTNKEGEELKKILYYYPITDNADVQVKNVGLVEGIIHFTETFRPSSPVNALHTTNTRQLYFQPEKNYWIVMTLHIPNAMKAKDGLNNMEPSSDDDIQDIVYEALLKQSYYVFRLFWNTFQSYEDVGNLKMRLEKFFNPYLKCMKLEHADILNVFNGIQYLPLDRHIFLKVQCFINLLESSFPDICHTLFLYNEHLIWSGVEPADMQTIYSYLTGTLLPASLECELQGGSMPRGSSMAASPSPFARHARGRFITGDGIPKNVKQSRGKASGDEASSTAPPPRVYLFAKEIAKPYYFLVYRALSATVCFLIEADATLTNEFFHKLDEQINQKLVSLVTDISEQCLKQVGNSSSSSSLSSTSTAVPALDSSPRFIYFNKLNLAYKSTVHNDNKHTGNLACPRESVDIMANIHQKINKDTKGKGKLLPTPPSETIVKTINDSWVVGKQSNSREFYIALQQKNASLIDISEEVKKLCDSELKKIFFHTV